MNKKLKLVAMALCVSSVALAQEADSVGVDAGEQAFIFTEAQLGENDDLSQSVVLVNSNTNIYASQVGYQFNPARFRYRAFNQKYNEVFINGAPMNDMESGLFRFTLVGGLNQQTRNMEYSLPFDNNTFSMSAMGGSNNYNFRPSSFATGQRLTLTGANRNYKVRAMYTYNSGVKENGWALSANVTYRWADEGYVEGSFYNSLSYFFGAEKLMGDHRFSFVTWGNPTERGAQGASTDEMYWLANDRYYNPYWGYQNGKKRNSRVVTDYQPTALMTWDWKIDNQLKLTTTLTGRYSMYKGTRLNYNNADKPQGDYWKNLPSSYYDVWNRGLPHYQTDQCMSDWLRARTIMSGNKADRQIQFDRLMAANRTADEQGLDAMYYIYAKRIDNLNLTLASSLNYDIDKRSTMNMGVQLATNKGMHYQTMEDLMRATRFHNINTYAVGNYSMNDPQVQYDLNNPNGQVKVGDRYGYDYNIYVNKATFWGTYKYDFSRVHTFISGRVGATEYQRQGNMRNGMFAENSYGRSKVAHFLQGGVKLGGTWNAGKGHVFTFGTSAEFKAPEASAAFVSPEMNNDFVVNLKTEKVFSGELGYQFQNSWMKANITGYYSQMKDVTEWQSFYFDDINSFSYVSMTGINKEYYGLEWGMSFKLSDAFTLKTIGTVSEAKNTNNAKVWYMSSTKGTYNDNSYLIPGRGENNYEYCLNKNMREAGTPLTAVGVILGYRQNGWFIDLSGNYYDRIYLSYSPAFRYESTIIARNNSTDITEKTMDAAGNVLPSALEQAKGKGGFMMDCSIGRSIYLHHGRSMSINLSISNLLNNQNIVTGGYEQSRSDYSSSGNARAYSFKNNPMKFYAWGINGMLNIAYKF